VKEYFLGGKYRRLGPMSGRELFAFAAWAGTRSAPAKAASRSPTQHGRARGRGDVDPPKGDDGLRTCRTGEVGCTFGPEQAHPYPPCPPWLPECGPSLVAENPPGGCPPWLPECGPPPLREDPAENGEAGAWEIPSLTEGLLVSAAAGPVLAGRLPDFLRINVCPVFEPLPALYGEGPVLVDILLSK
jgi:hypothetical protein